MRARASWLYFIVVKDRVLAPFLGFPQSLMYILRVPTPTAINHSEVFVTFGFCNLRSPQVLSGLPTRALCCPVVFVFQKGGNCSAGLGSPFSPVHRPFSVMGMNLGSSLRFWCGALDAWLSGMSC